MADRNISRMRPDYDGTISPAFTSLMERYGATPDLVRTMRSGTSRQGSIPDGVNSPTFSTASVPALAAPHLWMWLVGRLPVVNVNWTVVRAAAGAFTSLAFFVAAIAYTPAPMGYKVAAYGATGEVFDDSNATLKPFEISDITGDAIELRPGNVGERLVRISNPNKVAIDVENLGAVPGQPYVVGGQRLTECPAGVLQVAPVNERLHVPAGHSEIVRFEVEVSNTVPKGCSDAVFPLTYSGRARASR
ncbi:hypothetical protein ACIA8G_02370 [Lentzea sp. NPDC051213]|uniref:hypothetical protein n=1 Tax=Lentzea sp. NPDC051213 TaxID=3364126 RepID=UPI003787FD3E